MCTYFILFIYFNLLTSKALQQLKHNIIKCNLNNQYKYTKKCIQDNKSKSNKYNNDSMCIYIYSNT